jgi:hypothetical protein
MRLVAEVNASFEELAHAEIRQSHSLSFPVQASTDLDKRENPPPPAVSAGFLPDENHDPCVECRRI